MGGYNSGRRGGKRTTDDMHVLDIRHIQRAGRLTPGQSFSWQWSRRGEVIASINIRTDTDRVTLIYRSRVNGDEWQDMNYPVYLAWTDCHYGGQRAWWLCPAVGCGRRVALLYAGKMFACRHCQQLAYASDRVAKDDKPYSWADKLRKRLGWCAGVANPPGNKPRGMHWQTYLRLLNQLNGHSRAAMQSADRLVSRLTGKLGSIGVALLSL